MCKRILLACVPSGRSLTDCSRHPALLTDRSFETNLEGRADKGRWNNRGPIRDEILSVPPPLASYWDLLPVGIIQHLHFHELEN